MGRLNNANNVFKLYEVIRCGAAVSSINILQIKYATGLLQGKF